MQEETLGLALGDEQPAAVDDLHVPGDLEAPDHAAYLQGRGGRPLLGRYGAYGVRGGCAGRRDGRRRGEGADQGEGESPESEAHAVKVAP
ncbi:hypothetical protein GCM10027026_07120 [Myroides odoratimimus subsp. xuanwuensis]